MKKLSLLFVLLPFMAAAQNNSYTITGNLSSLKTPFKAYLITLKNGAWRETDSAEIKDGKFQFAGSVTEPHEVMLAIKPLGSPQGRTARDTQAFFLENSKISIAGTESIRNATVSGSVADRENREREAMIKINTAKLIKYQDVYGEKSADGQFIQPLAERQKAADSIKKWVAMNKDINRQFAETHLNSFSGLYAFNNHVLDSSFDPARVEPLFNRFSASLKSSPLGRATLEKIEIGKRRQAGAKVTDFTQNDLNGKPFTLSSLRGKYVLIDFWASWCAPCRAENPNVVKAYQQLKDKNFEIVGVSLDYPGGKEVWAEAVRKDGLPWIHVSDLKGWKNEVALMYGINSVPQNVLVNPEGIIVAKNLRGENLLEKLKTYIK